MSDPIRIAFIGTGLIVRAKHWPALSALTGDFQVVALANRSSAKAEALADTIEIGTGLRPAVYADYEAMLANEALDAVSLALPTIRNPEVIHAALGAGCHVIAEKPIAASLEDARRVVSWAGRDGRVLMIAENFRYLTGFQRAARLIAEGAIGRPVSAHWLLYKYQAPDNPYTLTSWRQKPEHPGGFLSDGGVHHAAVLRSILGEVKTVRASVASYRNDLVPVDTLAAVLTWESGATGTYHISYAVRGIEEPLSITGTEGTVLVDRTWAELHRNDASAERWEEPIPVDGLGAMYADFARAIRTGSQPLSTPSEALADLQLIVAMLRSAETGCVVDVAEV